MGEIIDRNKIIKSNKALVKILSKMCEMVGISIDDVDFNDSEWFLRHEWTMEQQKEFSDWLTDMLINDKELRMELIGISHKLNKRQAESYANGFIFNHGWKTKIEERS